MKRAFVENQFDAQTSYYSSEFADARHDIITLAGHRRAGRTCIRRPGTEQISILDIAVLPQYRRRGIGSAIVGSLVAEAGDSGRTVRVLCRGL
jgi:ribosomal protein S18 acetylase RimI-like enzyme